MKFKFFVEGCLDRAVLEAILESIGYKSHLYEITIQSKDYIFRNVKNLLQRLEDIDACIMLVVDADTGIYDTLDRFKRELSSYVEIGAPIGNGVYPLKVNGRIIGGIIVWCKDYDECTGRLEDLLRNTMARIHGCNTDYTGVVKALGCSGSQCSSRFPVIVEKLSVILAMVGCSGRGTLVYARGDGKCGLEVKRAVKPLLHVDPMRDLVKSVERLLGSCL